MSARVYIGLGSNLDRPHEQIEWALAALAQIRDTHLDAAAPLYRSRAVGPGAQPDYINTVARLRTRLTPHALLYQLLALENERGRCRRERWGPRTLDLDILLYDALRLTDPALMIPHPHLAERSFVLLPLHDLDPELILPDGTAVAGLLARADRAGIVRL